MTKITAFAPGLYDKPAAVRQADLANQRDSWLRQMELAQLTGMDRARAPLATPQNQNTELAANWRVTPQPHDAAGTPLNANANTGQANDQAQQDVHSDGEHAKAGNKQPAAPSSWVAQGTADTPGASADDGPRGAKDAPSVAYAGAQAAATQAATMLSPAPTMYNDLSATSQGANAGGTVAAALGALPRAAMSASESVARGNAPAMTAPAVRDVSRPSLSSAPDWTAPPEDEVQQEDSAHSSAPEREAQLDSKPTWQKRMMHLTGKGQDVKLWIRDSELGQAQSASLIYRLSNDMAGMGLRLKNATVNGKPALRAGSDAALDTDTETAYTTITNTKEDHGTR